MACFPTTITRRAQGGTPSLHVYRHLSSVAASGCGDRRLIVSGKANGIVLMPAITGTAGVAAVIIVSRQFYTQTTIRFRIPDQRHRTDATRNAPFLLSSQIHIV